MSWYEAVAFCRWLTERLTETGELEATVAVQLPTENQWEKAARGPDGRAYPWGVEPDPERANYMDTGLGTPSAVGCFPHGGSAYGVEEMSGNVWEWCRTQWQDSYDGYVDDNDLEEGALRVLRGGAFSFNRNFVRCAARYSDVPNWLDWFNGFRLVASPFTSDR